MTRTMASLSVRTVFLRAFHQLQCVPLTVNQAKSRENIHIMMLLGIRLKSSSIPYWPLSVHRRFHTSPATDWSRTSRCELAHDGNSNKKAGSSAALNPRFQEIRLVLEGDNEQVMVKSKAEQLASERHLKLVLRDAKSKPHPTYELMTGAELATERTRIHELKRVAKKKAPKEMRLTAKISTHDLDIKVKKVIELLRKGQDVKISIKLNAKLSEKASTDVFKYVTDHTKDFATVGQSQKSTTELLCLLKSLHGDVPDAAASKIKPYTVSELKQQAVDKKKQSSDASS